MLDKLKKVIIEDRLKPNYKLLYCYLIVKAEGKDNVLIDIEQAAMQLNISKSTIPTWLKVLEITKHIQIDDAGKKRFKRIKFVE